MCPQEMQVALDETNCDCLCNAQAMGRIAGAEISSHELQRRA
jgi:hypothetical protein